MSTARAASLSGRSVRDYGEPVTLVSLLVLLVAVFFYVLFLVVRAAVRSALDEHVAAQARRTATGTDSTAR